MDRNLISKHKLIFDPYERRKVRILLWEWSVFVIILALTRISSVQSAMIRFSNSTRENLLISFVDFIINGLPFATILLAVYTVAELWKKQTFNEIHLYDSGMTFFSNQTAEFHFVPYSEVQLARGKTEESFWIQSKTALVPLVKFEWQEYEKADLLLCTLEEYGNWFPYSSLYVKKPLL